MSAVLRSTFAVEDSVSAPQSQLASDVRSLRSDRVDDHRLLEVQDRFIDAWAKMAVSFAMNRTLGRVHALIYISLEPIELHTIAARLALTPELCKELVEELMAWGLIRASQAADGSTAYVAEQDPWSWFLRTVRERYQREFVPLHQSVREVLEHARELARGNPALRGTLDRVERFSRFIDEFMRFVDAFVHLGAKPMATVIKTVAKLMPRGRSL